MEFRSATCCCTGGLVKRLMQARKDLEESSAVRTRTEIVCYYCLICLSLKLTKCCELLLILFYHIFIKNRVDFLIFFVVDFFLVTLTG